MSLHAISNLHTQGILEPISEGNSNFCGPRNKQPGPIQLGAMRALNIPQLGDLGLISHTLTGCLDHIRSGVFVRIRGIGITIAVLKSSSVYLK
jgi:hypothetical protein